MFKREILKTALIILVIAAIIMVVGCNSERMSTVQYDTDGPEKVAPIDYNEPLIKNKLLWEESADKELALETNLSLPDVAAGRSWIENQGYVFSDTNSFVAIEEEYHLSANDLEVAVGTEPSFGKRTPEVQPASRLVRADSIVWLAFENPTHDMANHTAIITAYQGGEIRTMFVELDVSSETPSLIRGGLISGGQFTSDENGAEHLESWLGCVLGLELAAAITCLGANVGYGACIGLATAGVLLGCTVQWAFSL